MSKIINIKPDERAKKSIGERSIYTQEIIKMMRKIKENELITYEDLENGIGMSVRPLGEGYCYQKSARDILEREENVVFEVISKIGFRRISSEKVALSTAAMYLKKKKSIIKKHQRRINTVSNEYKNLTPNAKIQTTLARTLIAFDSEMSKADRTLKIEGEIKKTNKLIGFDGTMSLFKNK